MKIPKHLESFGFEYKNSGSFGETKKYQAVRQYGLLIEKIIDIYDCNDTYRIDIISYSYEMIPAKTEEFIEVRNWFGKKVKNYIFSPKRTLVNRHLNCSISISAKQFNSKSFIIPFIEAILKS